MALYGVGLNVNVQKLLLDFKLHLAKSKGDVTLRCLQKVFERNDKNGNQIFYPEDFEKCLNQVGFFLKVWELQTLSKYFIKEGEKGINYNQFISEIREPLNERRLKLVIKAYNLLDQGNQGFITDEIIDKQYNVSKYKDYISGKKSREEILNNFLSKFQRNKEGKIPQDDFIQYYADFSISIPSDSLFIEKISNEWGINEEGQQQIAKEELKGIVKTLRQKLIQATQGTHEEFLLRKIFKEFDTNKSGFLTLDELYAMTIKLEVPISMKYLQPIFEIFDKNRNGTIEFEEFVNYIVNDPYP